MNQDQSPNPDLLAKLKASKNKVREKLPDQKTFDLWHIESSIEELDDIAQDIGMYKRMLLNPNLRVDNRALLQNLLKLDDQRYWKLENEIERLMNEYKTQDVSF